MNKESNTQAINGFTPCVSTEPVEEKVLLTVNGKSIKSVDREVRIKNVCEVLSLHYDEQLAKLKAIPLFCNEIYEFQQWDEETREPIYIIGDTTFFHWLMLLPTDLYEVLELQHKCSQAIYEAMILNS